MGIFTPLTESDISKFLLNYDLGDLLHSEGIAQGVENTNYFVETASGKYVLTIFEGRTDQNALPFFLDLMAHLSSHGFPCPQPAETNGGELLGEVSGKQAALLTWLAGDPPSKPTPQYAWAAARALASLHDLTRNAPGQRQNDLGLKAFGGMLKGLAGRLDDIEAGLGARVAGHLEAANSNPCVGLPKGVIHGDLFPDNVLFLGENVGGIIDFYFACNDFLAYDLAIMLCAWSQADGHIDREIAAAILGGYQGVRPLDQNESDNLVHLMRIASLRFLLSRAEDMLNPRSNAIVEVKDPLEFARLLDSLEGAGKSLIGELVNAG